MFKEQKTGQKFPVAIAEGSDIKMLNDVSLASQFVDYRSENYRSSSLSKILPINGISSTFKGTDNISFVLSGDPEICYDFSQSYIQCRLDYFKNDNATHLRNDINNASTITDAEFKTLYSSTNASHAKILAFPTAALGEWDPNDYLKFVYINSTASLINSLEIRDADKGTLLEIIDSNMIPLWSNLMLSGQPTSYFEESDNNSASDEYLASVRNYTRCLFSNNTSDRMPVYYPLNPKPVFSADQKIAIGADAGYITIEEGTILNAPSTAQGINMPEVQKQLTLIRNGNMVKILLPSSFLMSTCQKYFPHYCKLMISLNLNSYAKAVCDVNLSVGVDDAHTTLTSTFSDFKLSDVCLIAKKYVVSSQVASDIALKYSSSGLIYPFQRVLYNRSTINTGVSSFTYPYNNATVGSLDKIIIAIRNASDIVEDPKKDKYSTIMCSSTDDSSTYDGLTRVQLRWNGDRLALLDEQLGDVRPYNTLLYRKMALSCFNAEDDNTSLSKWLYDGIDVDSEWKNLNTSFAVYIDLRTQIGGARRTGISLNKSPITIELTLGAHAGKTLIVDTFFVCSAEIVVSSSLPTECKF
jgi:hypothetical protein